MKSLIKFGKLTTLRVFLPSLFSLLLIQCQSTPRPASVVPNPREITKEERAELVKLIAERFKGEVPPDARYRGGGPFRFVNTESFLYIDRTDIGSVIFELPKYGDSKDTLDPSTTTKEALLPRIRAGFRATGMRASGRQFRGFQDEFVGSIQPSEMPPDFDPHKTSKLAARTAAFQRIQGGVPIFGSELLVGLMPNGKIGRFRLHWPRIESELVSDAEKLQKALRNKTWALPEIMRSDDIEILEISAGVGHSGFADPGFRVKAVVRVLFRKIAEDTRYPISSTSYKYFDESGQEIIFSNFPKIPGTTDDRKSIEKKPENPPSR